MSVYLRKTATTINFDKKPEPLNTGYTKSKNEVIKKEYLWYLKIHNDKGKLIEVISNKDYIELKAIAEAKTRNTNNYYTMKEYL